MMLCIVCHVNEAVGGGNYCGSCPRPRGKGKLGASSGGLIHLKTNKPAKKAAAPRKAAPAKKAAAPKKAGAAKKTAPAKKAAAK